MDLYYCSCNHEEESYLFLLFDSFVKLGNLFGLIYFLVQCNAVDKLVSYLRNESNDTYSSWVNIVPQIKLENELKENYNIIDDDSDNNSNSSNDIIDN